MTQRGSGAEALNQSPLDALAEALMLLRDTHGSPSYAALATTIARRRELEGMSPAAARLAKTTVYDCFRTGRSRINVDLVREIVWAITDDEATADAWRQRATDAVIASRTEHAPLPEPVTLAEPVESIPLAEPAEAAPPPEPVEATTPWPRTHRVRWATAWTLGNIVLCLAVGTVFHGTFPLFLDMIATAVVAVVLGPGAGALVGLAMVVGTSPLYGTASLWFAPVEVAGALVWGYGFRLLRRHGTVPTFAALSAASALASTVVATTVLATVFHGDELALTVKQMSAATSHLPRALSVFLANLMTSVLDKTLATAIALAVASGRPFGTVRERTRQRN